MYIKGVNLGNWLVLEKWMSPALFEGTTAEDEYYLPRQLSKEVYEARIKIHRAEYITERDFLHIKALNLNCVRIPIPYFIFGDREPFIGCIQELDNAFNWAKKYDLQILLDLHTAPEGQNGFDNGGICGVCKWSQNPKEVAFVLSVLERLAQRYGNHSALFGIEVLNEPITENAWKIFDVPNRYRAVDEKMAQGSKPNTIEFLKDFYIKAYHRLRKYLPVEKYIVIHDGFELMTWKDFMQEDTFQNVILDTHQYLMIAEADGCKQELSAYLTYIKENYAKQIKEMSAYFPIICGEWCLFNSLACGYDTKGGQNVFNGVINNTNNNITDKEKIYQEIAKAQLSAWQQGNGYFYWSYKLLIDTVNNPNWQGWDSWDFDRCIDLNYFANKEI